MSVTDSVESGWGVLSDFQADAFARTGLAPVAAFFDDATTAAMDDHVSQLAICPEEPGCYWVYHEHNRHNAG